MMVICVSLVNASTHSCECQVKVVLRETPTALAPQGTAKGMGYGGELMQKQHDLRLVEAGVYY